jgi:hypothetical protein
LNPAVSAFPAACGGVSERHKNNIYSLRIEDSPQLAAESFNTGLTGYEGNRKELYTKG